MKLLIEPTNRFTTFNGQRVRVWRATEVDDSGDRAELEPPVAVLVATVAPPAEHPVCAVLERTLEEIGLPNEIPSLAQAIDVREVIDRRQVS